MSEQKDLPQVEEIRAVETAAKEGDSKRYSKGLKEVSMVTEDLGDISTDVVSAVEKGLRRFRKASNESAKKKKDGALVDLLPNLGKGLSTTMDAAKDIPTEIGEALDTKTTRRAIRQISRGLSSVFGILK